jgi:hypothetical protein
LKRFDVYLDPGEVFARISEVRKENWAHGEAAEREAVQRVIW